MKNIFTLMLAIITASHCFAYDFEVDGIYYNILSEEDKTVEVTYKDSNGNSYYGDIVINNTVSYSGNTYSVTSIGSFAFSVCTGLIGITIPNSVTIIKDGAFWHCTSLSSVTIPNNVTEIEFESFSGCNNLTCINIPNSVTEIGDYAFFYTNLESIEIPNSVTSIGIDAFSDCAGLTRISVDSGNRMYDSRNDCNAIIKTSTNTLLLGCKNTNIPNGVTSIESYAFSGCSGLIDITIPNSVTSIGHGAFFGCSGLIDITIPNSVTSIGYYAFESCNSIKDFYVNWNNPIVITSSVFNRINLNNVTLHVPEDTYSLYKSASVWKNFKSIEEIIPEFIEISDGTSYNRKIGIETKVTYTRNFTNTNWQSMYVPFSIPVSKLTEAGLVVAELNDTHQRDYNSDGVADSTWIEFFTLQSGSTDANYPYLIKTNTPGDVTINLENVIVEPSESASIECSTTRQRFTFTGTYDGVSGTEMYSNNYYALSGGSLKRAASSNASIKPQRWYMTIENKNGTTPSYFAPSMRFIVDGIEDETTIIDCVLESSNDSRVYSITSSAHPGELKPGVYVQNCKKIMVK